MFTILFFVTSPVAVQGATVNAGLILDSPPPPTTVNVTTTPCVVWSEASPFFAVDLVADEPYMFTAAFTPAQVAKARACGEQQYGWIGLTFNDTSIKVDNTSFVLVDIDTGLCAVQTESTLVRIVKFFTPVVGRETPRGDNVAGIVIVVVAAVTFFFIGAAFIFIPRIPARVPTGYRPLGAKYD